MPRQSNDEMSPRLSGKTRLFLAGNFLSMLGTGLVLPFMIIYLHQARGISLPVVGGMLAAGDRQAAPAHPSPQPRHLRWRHRPRL